MKKKAIFATGIFAVLFWGAIHFGALAANVTASWSYDYSPLPACSGSQAADCIDHFEVKDLTNQQKPRTILTVNNPAGATGKIDGIKTSFRYGPPFGEVTFSVVAVAREKSGELVSSNPYATRSTVTIRPGVRASLVF